MLKRVSATLAGLALVACIGFSTATEAQKAPDAERLAAARDLLVVAGSTKSFDAMLPLIMQQMEGLFLKMKPANGKEISEVFVELSKRFSSRKGEMLEEIALLYAGKFTVAEMREIGTFFKSGVGAKFVSLQPELMKEGMEIGQRWGLKIGQEIEADVRKELKKRGIDL